MWTRTNSKIVFSMRMRSITYFLQSLVFAITPTLWALDVLHFTRPFAWIAPAFSAVFSFILLCFAVISLTAVSKIERS